MIQNIAWRKTADIRNRGASPPDQRQVRALKTISPTSTIQNFGSFTIAAAQKTSAALSRVVSELS